MPIMKRAPMGDPSMTEPTDGGTGGGDDLMQMLLRGGLGTLGSGGGGMNLTGMIPAILQQILMSKVFPTPGAQPGGMTKRTPTMGDALPGGSLG